MDNLTHTITGLLLSRAGLNRITASATPLLLVAANLPDFDIVSALGGALNYLHWHRNLTHSLFAAPILAIALTALYRVFVPKIAFWPSAGVALCGILSHILLDLTNIYGVRLLLPFQGTWFHWDLTPIIDFWIWAALLIAIAAPMLSRLVGSEIGDRHNQRYGRNAAIAGLLALVCYDGGRALIRNRVVQTVNARIYDGVPPVRVAAFPYSTNPLHWQGVAETSLAYHEFDMQMLVPFDPAAETRIDKVPPSIALEKANRTEAFRVFGDFAQYPWYTVVALADREGAQEVQLSDLRFNFTSTAILNRGNQVESSVFRFGPANPK